MILFEACDRFVPPRLARMRRDDVARTMLANTMHLRIAADMSLTYERDATDGEPFNQCLFYTALNRETGETWRAFGSAIALLDDDADATEQRLADIRKTFADDFAARKKFRRAARRGELSLSALLSSNDEARNECRACGRLNGWEGVFLKCCARCKRAWYCGEECQRRDWRARHKAECRATVPKAAAAAATPAKEGRT